MHTYSHYQLLLKHNLRFALVIFLLLKSFPWSFLFGATFLTAFFLVKAPVLARVSAETFSDGATFSVSTSVAAFWKDVAIPSDG